MLRRYENETFKNQGIQLDGNQYIQCMFQNCTLQFGGLLAPKIIDCKFFECSWSFTDAAARTLEFLKALYHGAAEGGKELIERTFENIRHGQDPIAFISPFIAKEPS